MLAVSLIKSFFCGWTRMALTLPLCVFCTIRSLSFTWVWDDAGFGSAVRGHIITSLGQGALRRLYCSVSQVLLLISADVHTEGVKEVLTFDCVEPIYGRALDPYTLPHIQDHLQVFWKIRPFKTTMKIFSALPCQYQEK